MERAIFAAAQAFDRNTIVNSFLKLRISLPIIFIGLIVGESMDKEPPDEEAEEKAPERKPPHPGHLMAVIRKLASSGAYKFSEHAVDERMLE